MAKILKLDGDMVSIGTDDGKIRMVNITNVNYKPTEGDEVDIYESDGSVIVSKKEVTNTIEQFEIYNNTNKSKKTHLFLFITIIASIAACFLPLISISVFGYSLAINYVYNSGAIADGVIVIGIQIFALIFLACKVKVLVVLLELGAITVFGITVVNLFSKVSSSLELNSIFNFLGVGFYLLVISLVLSVILSFTYKK